MLRAGSTLPHLLLADRWLNVSLPWKAVSDGEGGRTLRLNNDKVEYRASYWDEVEEDMVRASIDSIS